MFENQRKRSSSPFLKMIPLALVVFIGLVSAVLYFGTRSEQQVEELTDVLHSGDADFEWYKKYVELENPKIQMGLNFAGNRIVMFSGVIKNGGEHSLDVVELEIVFLNYDDPVWNTTRVPIRPGPYTPAIPALTERAFSFYIEDIPEGWMAGHAEMAISGFRFVDPMRS
jgi:hypothetical protein